MGDYHDLYVQLDTLLLADCFENFRTICLKEYKLDPCYFVSTPGFAFEACLKKTGVKIELLRDIDMILMVEKGIRGGITQAIHRYASANNKYMSNYNSNYPSTFSTYLDANNLYGWAMIRKMPLNNLNWVKNLNKFTTKNIMNYDETTNEKGYLIDVDVEYPRSLEKEHSELPFLASKGEKPTCNTQYSRSIQKARKNNNSFLPCPNQKLLTSITDKNRYIVQITTLAQALKHGLILKKVHRVLSYNHSNWLKHHIDMNTKLRGDAKNEFEKDFFKLMNNAVFGKMIENVREHRDIKLVVTEARRKKLTSQPNFVSSTIFSEDLEAIEMRKTTVLMNKPIAVGQCILDKSKELMYTFWYDVIKPMYKDKAKLLYMDTDSFIILLQTDDFFKDISDIVDEWFDTSKYDKNLNRPLKTGVNKKVIGKFKDELNGMIITEYIGIRPKVYAYNYLKDNILKEEKRCKGTAKQVVKDTINFETMKRTLFNNETVMCTQQRFRSDRLVMNTEIVNKKALSNSDNKRLQTFDGITTYPIGTNAFKVCESEMKIVLKSKHLCSDTYYASNSKIADDETFTELRDIAIPLCYDSKC